MRIGGRRRQQPAEAVQQRARRSTRSPAFGMAVITPLVFAGAVGAAPSLFPATPAAVRAAITPVAARVALRPRYVRSQCHRRPARADQLPRCRGHHLGAAAPDDRQYAWRPGHSDDRAVGLSQRRNEDGRRGPGLRRQLEPAGRHRAHRVGPRQQRRRRRERHRGLPDLRPGTGRHAARQRGHPAKFRRQSPHLRARDGTHAVPARHLGALRLRRQKGTARPIRRICSTPHWRPPATCAAAG